jgi:hypothetical protein
MPLAGFEPTIPVFKRVSTFHALEGAANMTGNFYSSSIRKITLSFLSNVRRGLFTRVQTGRSVKLTTYLHIVPS